MSIENIQMKTIIYNILLLFTFESNNKSFHLTTILIKDVRSGFRCFLGFNHPFRNFDRLF